MRTWQIFGLVALATSLGGVMAGCTEDEASDRAPTESQILSTRQLNGSDMPNKTLSLTLDDGPGPRTREVAEYLNSVGVKATFFINGMNVSAHTEAIDAIIKNGHILGNHTQHHKQLTRLGSETVLDEVAQTDAIVTNAQPNGPFILRAPFGAWSGSLASGLNAGVMRKYVGSVFWDEGGELTDHSAADWACWSKGVSVERCGELYLEEIHANGRGIILAHDIHSRTVDMVKQIVPVLLSEGYTFVRLDEVPSVKRALEASAGLNRATGPENEGPHPSQD